jgi:hypothetical protein
MAYSQDVLTRIVNVHWGGAFISGADGQFPTDDLVRSITFDSTAARWAGLGSLSFGGAGFAGCSACGPVVVLGGRDESGNSCGVIMASKDGNSWNEVYRVTQGTDDASEVFGLVWDGVQFWGGAGHLVVSESDDDQRYDILLSSPDGFEWSEAGRHAVSGSDYTKGLLAAKCSGRVTDESGNGVPDGVYGYNSETDTLIVPTLLQKIDYATGHVKLASDTPPTTVLRNGGSVDVGIPVVAVAYAQGIWVAVGGKDGGNPRAVHSFDDGMTWTEDAVAGNSHKIWTVSGPAQGTSA